MIVTPYDNDPDIQQYKIQLLGSLLLFTKTFFKLYTGREFNISTPQSREPHQITICKTLTDIFYLKNLRLYINIPPGHGKSTFLTYFVAWAFAHYPDCQFLYISYGQELAAKHTANIKAIMQMPTYQQLFGVKIDPNSSAKDDFATNYGGRVKAFGSNGSITGQDAGLPGEERFTGCVIMDDMHKPGEVFSDRMREYVMQNYGYTIQPRPRSPIVPMVAIGQRLHEDDIFNMPELEVFELRIQRQEE